MYYTTEFKGRLGNICLEICNSYEYCLSKNIQNDIVYNFNYIETSNYHSTKSYVIYDNFPLFFNIKSNFIDNYKLENFINIKKTLNLNINRKILFSILYNESVWKNILAECPIKNINEYDAIHVRRTDFLKWKNGNFVYTKDEILKLIDSDKKYIFFSDDINYCYDNFHSYNNCYFINKQVEYKDLILMTCCNNIHRKGSSFSFIAKSMNDIIRLNNSQNSLL